MKNSLTSRLAFLMGLLALLGTRPAHGQAPVWQWASSPFETSRDGLGGMATDSAGNALVTGAFSGTITLGSTTLVSTGGLNVYVGKLDPAGNWLWAVRANSPGSIYSRAIAVDRHGDAYLTGQLYDPASFGSFTVNPANGNVFVAKVSAAGQWQWATAGGRTSSGAGVTGIAVGPDGRPLVTGSFYGASTQFGTFTVPNPSLNGRSDLFVAQLTPTGTWQWATSAGSPGEDVSGGVAVDDAGYVYVTGSVSPTSARFGSLTLAVPSGTVGGFVARLTADGSWRWVRGIGGSANVTATALDAGANVYVTGQFFGPAATFGATTLTTSQPGSFNSELYVATLDSAGSWRWATGGGGPGHDTGTTLAVSPTGEVAVAGSFGGGTLTLGTTTLTNTATGGFQDVDVFVGRLDAAGAWQGAVSAGGPDEDLMAGVAFDHRGGLYAQGAISGPTATFGSLTVTHTPVFSPTAPASRTSRAFPRVGRPS